MSVSLSKLNDITVKKINLPDEIDPSRIRGKEINPHLYGTNLLLAGSGSGKTTILNTILEKCCDKFTRVVFFNNQIMVDPAYQYIFDWMDKAEIQWEAYENLDTLPALIEEIHQAIASHNAEKRKLKDNPIEEEKETEAVKQIKKMLGLKERRIKIHKKLISPDICFVFDDISSELKGNRYIASLLKMIRKYRIQVWICTQHVSDIPRSIRSGGIILYILLKNNGFNELKTIWEDANMSKKIRKDDFIVLYKTITNDGEPYDFLVYDSHKNIFRKNFTHLIEI